MEPGLPDVLADLAADIEQAQRDKRLKRKRLVQTMPELYSYRPIRSTRRGLIGWWLTVADPSMRPSEIQPDTLDEIARFADEATLAATSS